MTISTYKVLVLRLSKIAIVKELLKNFPVGVISKTFHKYLKIFSTSLLLKIAPRNAAN